MKFKIFKIAIMYLAITVIISFLIFVIYNSLTMNRNRIVYINGHEYIETGIRHLSLIHSESCKHESHKIE